ncbi:unnamed protein product [Mycena citricolor]|uniref:Pheromone receptor n=1 Tax=Mycena citricolor TaxID=2018698 RepID=A0AAD2H9Z6_9AGAR|nr:unnamed protein product [Mycena citricolor]
MTYYDPYPLYPVFAFIGFVIVLIPLPWHLQAWNAGTCLFMFWTALACLNNFINSIIWRDNVIDWAPVWCDISTRITVGLSVGMPAASLCINRRLYKIAACKTVSITKAEKRRAVIVDCAIGLGIPLIQMPLQYVVQGHRYDILEEIGCYPTTYNTPLAYPLSYVWPNVIALISAYYCIMSLCEFNRRRAQFAMLLSNSNNASALSISRYFRLMMIATIELIVDTPIGAYGLYLSIKHSPIHPWISWANTHYNFGFVSQVPSVFWKANPATVITLELFRWMPVVCAFVFFALFGFAAEARRHYSLAFWAIAKRLGYMPSSNSPGSNVFRRWILRRSPQSTTSSLPTSKYTSSSPPRTPTKRGADPFTSSFADSLTDVDSETGWNKEKSLASPSSSGSQSWSPPVELDALGTVAVPLPFRPTASDSRPARPATWSP